MEENFSCLYLFLRSMPAGLCPKKIGDWLLISLQFYLTGVFPALINPCHLHTFYDRGADITKSNLPMPKTLLDLHTKTLGVDITSGYTVRVGGTGLKVAGENSGIFLAPCDDEGIYKTDESDWVSVCNAEDLIDNTNTQLEFNVPVDTTAGTYRLIVKTASSTGNRVNKTLRTGIMEDVVTVKTA